MMVAMNIKTLSKWLQWLGIGTSFAIALVHLFYLFETDNLDYGAYCAIDVLCGVIIYHVGEYIQNIV